MKSAMNQLLKDMKLKYLSILIAVAYVKDLRMVS